MINDAYVSDIVDALARFAACALEADPQVPLERAALAQLAQTLETTSTACGLRGLTYLFRLLHKLPIAWPVAGFRDDDHATFADWIADCCDYVLTGESVDAARLIDPLLSLSFMPPVAPRAREMLRLALTDDAPTLARAATLHNGANGDTDHKMRPAAPTDTAPVTPTAIDGTTWISREELALIRDAVETQLLPAASAMLEQQDGSHEARDGAIDACLDQLALIAAAIDALGLAGLDRACAAYRRLVERLRDDSADATDDLYAAGLWPVLLAGHLDDPHDAAAAADLVDLLRERAVLDDAEAPSLRVSLCAVSIGIDPAQRQARKHVAEAADVVLEIAADVLPGVLAGMLRELPGRAAEFSASVQRYVHDHGADDLDHARRVAHTLKGDGNIVGVRGIANLTHALEEILSMLAASPQRASASTDALLVDAADCLEAMSDHVLGRGPAPERAVAELQRVYDCANALFDGTDDDATHDTITRPDAAPASAAAATEGDAPATITVPMSLLDDLLRLTGEAMIHARQIEDRVTRVERHHADIATQGRAFASLIAQLQHLVEIRGAALDTLRLAGSLDDLELDRYNELHTVTLRLVEASADTLTSAGELDDDVLGLRDQLSQQDRVQMEVRESVMQARQVSLRDISPRLARVVRQTARQLEKPCELYIAGDDIPLDKDLADALAEPLMHILRNAVDHGLEAPDLRADLGKPQTGRIDLAFRRDAGTLVVTCRDDGAGLDAAAVRQRAIERGILAADAEPDDAQIAALVMRSGFSTRHVATLTSGRGIGMDIVNRRILDLKGVLNLRSHPGHGCEIEFRVPLSQVAANVLMVEAANMAVAVGLDGVTRTVACDETDLVAHAGELRLATGETALPATRLETLLGFAAQRHDGARALRALIVEPAGAGSLAVLVDAVGDARAVIVKSLGPHAPPNPGLLGATILGDGSIAPVVDVQQLLRRRTQAASTPVAAPIVADAAPLVLVVDDSLSARRSLEQLIGDAGFRVAAARDGLEALERVNRQPPDLLVVDLEMPRMNGLELASFVRKSDTTRAIPIIMITSRTTERHRELARAAGVDMTLGKPYSEDRLLALIADFLQRGRAAAA